MGDTKKKGPRSGNYLTDKICSDCDRQLTRNEVEITKKMVGRHTQSYYCIDCLAAYMDDTPEGILDTIERYKESGCTAFG